MHTTTSSLSRSKSQQFKRQSSSYTPSSFLKGFTPSVILENISQSPIEKDKIIKEGYLADPMSSPSLSHISLYRNPIPPNLIKVLKKSSTRRRTLSIFKNKLGNIKEVDIEQTNPTQNKRVSGDQISYHDTFKTVKQIVDQGAKVYERKQKNRVMGSMFINDLWGQDYEQRIMKTTKVDKELKQESIYYRRPLIDKYEDLNKVFQERKYQAKVDRDIDNIKNIQRDLILEEPSQEFQDQILQDFSWNNKGDYIKDESPKARVTSKLKSFTLSHSPSNRRGKSMVMTPAPIKFNKAASIDRFLTSASPVQRRRPMLSMQFDSNQIESMSPIDMSPIGSTIINSRDELNLGPSQTSLTKTGGISPFNSSEKYALNKKKWNDFRQGQSVQTPSNFSATMKNRRSGNFSIKLGEITKSNGTLKEETKIVVGDLLEQCDNELKDKSDVIGLMNKLKRRFIQKRNVENEKKEVEEKRAKCLREIKSVIEFRNKMRKNIDDL